MGVGAAVAGVAAGVGAIGSAIIGSNAASNAASIQQQTAEQQEAAQQAAGQQAMQLNQQELAASQALLQPYANQGQVGLNALNNDLGYLDTPYAPTMAQLQATPGYQFSLQQGLLSTQNAEAAKGLGVSGAALNAASQYATGLAQNTYAQDAQIYQQNQKQIGDFLTGMVNNGQNAATAMGQEALGFTGNSTNALTGQTNAASQTALTGANDAASGVVGSANAITGSISGISNTITQAAVLNALMGQNGAGSPGVFSSSQLIAHQGGAV